MQRVLTGLVNFSIKKVLTRHPVHPLYRMMNVHPSDYYAWIKQPKSKRQVQDERLLGLIKKFWLESGCIYGYRKIFKDLRENGELSGKNRVNRLMIRAGFNVQVGSN